MIDTAVIIAGKGIGGLVLSYLLHEKGIDHILLCRRNDKQTISLGETLPPSALPLLQQLGLLGLFETHALQQTRGYHFCWGDTRVQDNNFYAQRPYQYGLKINKPAIISKLVTLQERYIRNFDKQLWFTAGESGISGGFDEGRQNIPIHAKFVVDATGRNRYVLHALGIPSVEADGLVAFSCHLHRIRHPGLVHPVYTESFEGGWGTVSSVAADTNAMTLFTGKGSPIQKLLTDYKNWSALLANTHYLKDFLATVPKGKIVGAKAGSSRAAAMAGNNWLAIGDAAIAFDPLSSHGITNVIYTAQKAATAIAACLATHRTTALKDYNDTLVRIFDQYTSTTSHIYSLERRWPEAAFWTSRING